MAISQSLRVSPNMDHRHEIKELKLKHNDWFQSCIKKRAENKQQTYQTVFLA